MDMKTKKKKWYTVILLYPDYMADDYGADIYVEWAHAEDYEEAVSIVRAKAVAAQCDNTKLGSCDTTDPNDFRPIAVMLGRILLEADATNF